MREHVVADVLDCDGADYDGAWGIFYDAAHAHHLSGTGPRAAPRDLFVLSAMLLKRWRPRVSDALVLLPDVMMGRRSPRALAGFCAYGFVTALFWECFDGEATGVGVGADIATCLQSLTTGLLDTPEWGPLEFSQSSRWPVKVLDIRLLWEHWSRCDAAVHLCQDVSPSQLRRGLGLDPEDTFALVGWAGMRSQLEMEQYDFKPLYSKSNSLRLVVVGSHLGSNMEPLSLVEAAMEHLSVGVHAVVYGTVYPFPGLICELFGHCATSSEFDEVISLLVRQMYKPRWEPIDLMNLLNTALQTDQACRSAEMILCAQPMPLCSLLRPLTHLPMLIYQAFPLIGATPSAHQHSTLMHFREMAQTPKRSVFIAYSEFLAAQFAHQVGQRPLCIRPHSLYATRNAMYDPDRENPRILVSRSAGWARNSAGALVNFVEAFADRDLRPGSQLRFVFLGVQREPSDTVAGLVHPFGYRELRRYRAAVFFPWDMGMLLFSELYSMGVPLFIPDRSWMAGLIKRMLEYTDFGWWQARYNTAVTLPTAPSLSNEVWPWLDPNSTIKHILNLYDQTDFVRWPHVESFASLPDLTERLLRFDFDGVSEQMQIWNTRALPHSLSILGNTLKSLLDSSAPPSQVGESSCI